MSLDIPNVEPTLGDHIMRLHDELWTANPPYDGKHAYRDLFAASRDEDTVEGTAWLDTFCATRMLIELAKTQGCQRVIDTKRNKELGVLLLTFNEVCWREGVISKERAALVLFHEHMPNADPPQEEDLWDNAAFCFRHIDRLNARDQALIRRLHEAPVGTDLRSVLDQGGLLRLRTIYEGLLQGDYGSTPPTPEAAPDQEA